MKENNNPNNTTTSEESSSKKKPEENPIERTEEKPEEFGGPKGLEPTRYGDWEKGGRVSDF